MIKEWLISRPKEDAIPLGLEDEQSDIHVGDYEAADSAVRSAWAILGGASDPSPADSYLVGAWDTATGELLSTLHPDYAILRPLGNMPPKPIPDYQGRPVGATRGGDATGELRYAHWALPGSRMRRIDADGALYPAENSPFRIDVRHKHFEYPDPSHGGWGWRAEIVGHYGNRNPGVHAIGIYADVECTQYLYTTGAFIRGVSEWQTDEDGAAIEVWYTENPPGFNNPEKEDWHVAVLEASLQKGYQTLAAEDDAIRYLFWEGAQEVPGAWVGSGITVTQIYGAAVYGVTDSSAFVVDEPLMIDGQETIFLREHAPGIIVCADHVASAVGKEIFWKR